MVQPESGPVCSFDTEFQKNICWEFLVAGSEQGIKAGQVGLRLITKTNKQTTVKEWSISATSIADGRWHIITLTIDAELGEATCYLDGNFDGYQTGLPLRVASCIWELGTDVWVGIRPPIDVDSFGRSDSEGSESKVHIMDVFLWGRCLTEDEIASLPAAMGSAEYSMIDLPDDNWQWADSPTRDSDPADIDLYDRDDVDWDGQYSSGRKRRSDRDGVMLDVDSFTRRLRKPRVDTQKEINQHMLSVEIAVKEALLARGESHFTGQEFPPNDRSLFMDPDNPPSKLQVVSEWMRPTDIVKEKHLGNHPCLFSGVANSSDVCQGRLGDCWFLSAVAVLTEVSRISEVIISPEYNQEGIYTVRFCIQGGLVPVVVDDWIPCESPGKPAFATSRKGNEMWVSLLEKAYAKLHGSYEALEGGLVQDALVDLTGGAGEEIDMRSAEAQIDLASGRLWSQLLRFKQEGFLLGAGSPSGSDVHISSSGIVQGHAYSILQVREVDGHNLVQIQNPWANEVEWNGPWSDPSLEWKHKLKHVPQANDGSFWMSWQDFQIHFRSTYVCRVYPPEIRYSIHGQWRGYSAGGCQDYDIWHQNPQYRLRASGPDVSLPIHGVSFSRTTVGFRNYQSSHDSMMFYIGMRILKTRGRRAAYNIYLHESIGGTDYVNSREISFSIHRDDEEQLFFFLSSTNDANKTPSPPLKSKEVSSWRSVSLSSGSFYGSGSGKNNFMDLSKSLDGHSKKVHPRKSDRDSSRDLSVPALIRTIRRLTKEKVQMASGVSSMLRNQVAERPSTKEEASILQAELDSRTRRLETEKNELQSVLEMELDRRSIDWSLKLEKYQIEQYRLRERARELAEQNVSLQREVSLFNEKEVDNRIKMSFSEKHLEDLSKRIEQVSEENQNLREKLSSEEMDIKQLQDDLTATVRGNDILKCEVQHALDALSYATPKLKYLELQVLKKDKNINQLTNGLQECMKELGVVKGILPKVFQERDFMWEEVKSYSEMNMLLKYEINMLKKKVDTLDEDILMKEGQITILKDWIGKPFDLLASPDSLLE
ncbi:Calpain-type cysteine protease DEK1 [Capsicum baccatum]|uniref:Calpain-type cysteine protease DEK1 n=1 Tax=Capsicum baccatum TaxID=33114 RepID=A0A2G2VJU8_CAPBA|nr:Calpain-type cysteine protease DEK1 [Capsicum baccatum]